VWILVQNQAQTHGRRLLAAHDMQAKRSVYVRQSETNIRLYYTGLTSNVTARLTEHTAGRCASTAAGRPWKIIVIVKFLGEERAARFEQYLKSGSGCAVACRHFR
jgi:predicted GIY-YIG superfamily endonuclease